MNNSISRKINTFGNVVVVVSLQAMEDEDEDEDEDGWLKVR